ncbi:MAG: hypothetical protein BWX88_02976 [Planctomycetes bacterium ADurb.Bin126]|nr:MAG: hypothetical protein BWX88_02976 [Planctomycetes bacterium ADurb.Bin126]HOD81593.1 DUF493 domain-containing protein [Phycisphaerae bacterium]HQL71854.1 DUF493 domain-containing protein [Phycisphaerae bacterium]
MKKTRPDIEYPCRWEYTIIGRSHPQVRGAAEAAAGGVEFELLESHVSRGGKYCSMTLHVVVEDEAQRDRIFLALREHPDVVMVI